MKVSPDRLLQLSLVLAVFAPHLVIFASRKCDPVISKSYSSRTPPGTCTGASVYLEIISKSHSTQTWKYECQLPEACIEATWQVKWTVNRIPMNATALYNSTDSSLPKFDKILVINATTKPPPKGFTVNPHDGYLYLVSSPEETVSVHLQCEGFVCLPNKTIHVTTNPPTTISRTKRDTTKFISLSSRSQPVTRQATDTTVSNTASSTDNAVIVANAEMQTSNTTVAIVVPLMVILVATVIVLGFLYHYGFLRKWALLDSYLARVRGHFTTSDPESSRPESDPLNSPPTSVL
ncbi:glycoprotein family protein m10 [Murid betaherpesvirus 1]|uniref:Glycoprotein family protein m10 n=1 Tax=Murid herpesvirus 1 (strain Smith) TaxID=10367 RepID=D3XDJ4_MUHVS|nr:glycoprotein family protein m10 [Murid betaherpesvirus 1]YP_214018.1 Glycoprotein family m02 [Murid betaherpesvirus 1]ADD10388.1 glycoprotein family protein m10 [Murid betaherpesvirus 1]AQQ81299.1 m10 protein [Murid betaherpesvirus 1]WEG71672.1 membrane protein m10 [Murid betaherpesvirus 1]CAJ1013230.1 m10 protein [Murid betaherpesvirus 1]CAJ1013398.1 m10 protein [Murid betaherpesvirus 1]